MVRMTGIQTPEKIMSDMIAGGRTHKKGERKNQEEETFLKNTLSSYGSMGSLILSEGNSKAQKLEMMEAVFTEIEKKETEKLMRGSPFNIGIMLTYFIRKSRECRRLIRALNAVQYKSQNMGAGG